MPGDSPGMPHHALTGWVVVGAGTRCVASVSAGGALGRTRKPTHSFGEKGPRVKMNDPTGALHTVTGPTGSFYRSPDQI